MQMFASKLWRTLTIISSAMWRYFRKLPGIIQSVMSGAISGGLLIFIFVGNMGLALMGFAIALPGLLVGAVGGALLVFVPFAIIKLLRNSRKK